MSKIKVVVTAKCDSFSHCDKCHKSGDVFEINEKAFVPNAKAGLIEKFDPKKHDDKKKRKSFKPDLKAPKKSNKK